MMCRQVIASVDAAAAGPSYTVIALAQALARHGHDSAVMAVGQRKAQPGLEIYPQDFANAPVLRRLQASRALASAVDTVAGQGAVLHMHGLWLLPNVYPAKSARRYDVPLVVSPRGMLGEQALAFSKARKHLVWLLGQRRALEKASCFHATSDAEAEDIRRAGLTAPIAVIPNGVDIPAEKPKTGGRTILHLGRLHPKKGVDVLIEAWAKIAGSYPDWRLRIVGPSELGYRQMLEALARRHNLANVTFDGPVFGQEKASAYRDAGLFVLPTLNENFGMVVAEALAAGVPVICTRGAPWQGLETEGCGWWIERDVDRLAATLATAIDMSDEARVDMGKRGRDWMRRAFGWGEIAEQLADVYAWCRGTGKRPGCVV